MGDLDYGIDMAVVSRIAGEIAETLAMGVEICIVIGGGNIFRGLAGAAQGMNRANADYMGMLATVMNALVLNNALTDKGVDARVLSAIPMPTVCEPFVSPRAIQHLEKGRVVIFAAGTGNPYFTTDTAAALRAAEMGCKLLLKGTDVDGVYVSDPKLDPTVRRYDKLTYLDVLTQNLRVMDASAITLARDNQISIIVFSIRTPGALASVLRGEGCCTVVGDVA